MVLRHAGSNIRALFLGGTLSIPAKRITRKTRPQELAFIPYYVQELAE